ncbi:MAG: hypothetical protein ACFWUA_05275 [Sporanaerobacter sp.]|jgi:hypothetical protein|uniref:hypothetical protein n=1 Tax=Sporanaerobacter sp. TaxID=2010183 RepID=UPI003A1019B2
MIEITNIKDLESVFLKPATQEDYKAILENLKIYKTLYINDINYNVWTKEYMERDKEFVANVVDNLENRDFDNNNKKDFYYFLGHITDYTKNKNKHKIWDIEEYFFTVRKQVNSGDIIIYKENGSLNYYLGIGAAAANFNYGFSCFKIKNAKKMKELIYTYTKNNLEITTEETLKLIKELKSYS